MFSRLIFGLENGLVVIDYLNQSILMNTATVDLYGTMDPFQRTSISPKRRGTSNDVNSDDLNAADYQVNIFRMIFLSLEYLFFKKIHISMNETCFSLALFIGFS